LSGAITVFIDAHMYQRQKLEEATASAKILAANVVGAVVFGDPDAASNALSGLAGNPEIDLGAAYDAEGKLLARYLRNPALAALVPETSPQNITAVQGQAVMVAVPVLQADTSVGTVYLRSRIESNATRLLRQAAILLAMGLVSLALALPVSMRLHRTVTNPI